MSEPTTAEIREFIILKAAGRDYSKRVAYILLNRLETAEATIKRQQDALGAVREIWLGNGDKLVTDIYHHEGWAGICVSENQQPVAIGDVVETTADTTDELERVHVIIKTYKADSLIVVIQACERAIRLLEKAEVSDE